MFLISVQLWAESAFFYLGGSEVWVMERRFGILERKFRLGKGWFDSGINGFVVKSDTDKVAGMIVREVIIQLFWASFVGSFPTFVQFCVCMNEIYSLMWKV